MTPKEREIVQQAADMMDFAAKYPGVKSNSPKLTEFSQALREALDQSGEANEMVQESVLLAKGFSEWNLDAETGKFLADMITAGDEPIEVTLRLGFIRDLDGSVQYGLLANETEYPEEGAVLLLELNPINAAPQSVSQEPVATDSAKKDAVFEASIQFIKTLTGMEPPPIEVAPPEVFAPFREFTEKVCKIFSEPPKAEREQPVSQEPVADVFEAKKTAFADCKQKVKAPDDVWTVSDGINFFGFFSHGWEYAKKYYTAPQPVKEVELTDDELKALYKEHGVGGLVDYHFARAVIAADREKNK